MGGDLLARLDGVKTTTDGWQARCPAHDDRTASLSICRGDDERWLVHCHAGCAVDAILAELHLERRDLFPSNCPAGGTNGKGQIEESYDYQTDGGELLFQAVRLKPKDFRQRRPDGDGGWLWNVKGLNRVVYRLPELQRKEAIFIAEGEKDADRLWSVGLPATTCSGGAQKWGDRYAKQLKDAGVKRVAILPDNDDAGRKHAQ